MRRLLITGAALMLGAAPVAIHAQDMAPQMTAMQQSQYDSWPAERQAEFMGWPTEYQTYYWTLTPTQQEAYWMLSVDQRSQIATMTPMQQQQTWTAIEAQLSSQPPMAATGTPGTMPSANANMVMRSNPVVQNIPPAHQGEYPLCTDGRTNNCINPREAGKNYGNVPLDHWPGQPASQMSAQEKMRADSNM
ncbi:hypothetical protein [Croceicoccus marinus]|jgi:hypothetical protein|uniref:Secreted protein n=1 Tax=Croceicoccus marinus TaxID=450378 RepID=A0A7G6VS14_9SPHN|nr:hypothetical protein [Croceicoccus marinus]QNE04529.1 hypothetical protein H4O24_11195 [Croceicoccus marinus]